MRSGPYGQIRACPVDRTRSQFPDRQSGQRPEIKKLLTLTTDPSNRWRFETKPGSEPVNCDQH